MWFNRDLGLSASGSSQSQRQATLLGVNLLIPVSSDARSPEVHERVRRTAGRVAQLESGWTLLFPREGCRRPGPRGGDT